MTYVYKCRQCGEQFEVQQRITEAPLRYHPYLPRADGQASWFCAGEVYRVPQVPGIVYRGRGFHTTDYSKEVRHDG